MLKVRLQRVGKKNDPSFRVVVTDSKNSAKTGKFLEIVGFYDPRKNTKQLNKERITHWLSVGAQASDTVHNILVGEKIIDGKKVNVLPKKSPIKKEGEEAPTEAASVAEAPAAEPKTEEPKAETPAESK